nr:MAG TPA: hypothetical protein [Caudoviricetes sp.]DAV90226.1 MAG TPA: hypothetical protein [Caudoviricetes sp.]
MAIRTTTTLRTLMEFVRILRLTNEEGDAIRSVRINNKA